MSHQHHRSIGRVYAGISFRPEVVRYLDDVAARVGMSRSWLVNTIVLEHARLVEHGGHASPLSRETVIQL